LLGHLRILDIDILDHHVFILLFTLILYLVLGIKDLRILIIFLFFAVIWLSFKVQLLLLFAILWLLLIVNILLTTLNIHLLSIFLLLVWNIILALNNHSPIIFNDYLR